MGSRPTEPFFAEAHDLNEMHRAFRDRAQQLNITRDTIDQIAGLTSGHASKLLAPEPLKHYGLRSFGPMLGALGLKLLVVEDPEALARVIARMEPADSERQRFKNRNHETARINMTTAPRYRATEDHTNLGHGFQRKGQEFTWPGWPKCFSGAVEPVNESAKRIMAYWGTHHMNGQLPLSPYNADHARIFLPAHFPSMGTRLPALPREEAEGMPRYRSILGGQFGPRRVERGEEIAFTAWPTYGLEPINDEAERVVAYYEMYRDNPRLLPSPWCAYECAIFLPDLPTPKRGPGSIGNRPLSETSDEFRQATAARLIDPAPASRPRVTRRRVA